MLQFTSLTASLVERTCGGSQLCRSLCPQAGSQTQPLSGSLHHLSKQCCDGSQPVPMAPSPTSINTAGQVSFLLQVRTGLAGQFCLSGMSTCSGTWFCLRSACWVPVLAASWNPQGKHSPWGSARQAAELDSRSMFAEQAELILLRASMGCIIETSWLAPFAVHRPLMT